MKAVNPNQARTHMNQKPSTATEPLDMKVYSKRNETSNSQRQKKSYLPKLGNINVKKKEKVP